MENPGSTAVLVFGSSGRSCALPLGHVSEIMRPLACQHLAGMPRHVIGVSVIRGVPVPVVSLAKLLDASAPDRRDERPGQRLVALEVEGRRLALAVSSVLGVRYLSLETFENLSELIGAPGTQQVGRIGTPDNELMLLLAAARLVPEQVWTQLQSRIR